MKHILILHGWKVAVNRYKPLQELLEKEKFSVLIPELPGFGTEKLLKPIMNLDDYVEFVFQYIEKEKIKKIILIGHSFGARVGAKFAYYHPEHVEKLILTGAPLIKQKLSTKKQIAFIISKIGKKLILALPNSCQKFLRKSLYFSLGEWDYYKSGELKETFKAIIDEDLLPILSKITVPTLLVWGERDTFVPLHVGLQIKKEIKNAKLEVIPDASHRLPCNEPALFMSSIEKFIL